MEDIVKDIFLYITLLVHWNTCSWPVSLRLEPYPAEWLFVPGREGNRSTRTRPAGEAGAYAAGFPQA